MMTEVWIAHRKPQLEARLRLFCFPCAGGSAIAYRPFVDDLAEVADVCPVELPGHGIRYSERMLVTQMAELVEMLAMGLALEMEEGPFAFFGHSMGAEVAFELARWLRREGIPGPVYLFASSHRAPQLPNPEATRHLLADPELAEYMKELGGTPPEILAHPEFLDMLLPLLRADLTLLNTYVYYEEPPLEVPILALGGTGDRMLTRNQLEPWKVQTTGDFGVQMFPGGHFYLNGSHPMLMERIRRVLEQVKL